MAWPTMLVLGGKMPESDSRGVSLKQKKKSPGRPPMVPELRHSRQLGLKLTPFEFETLEIRAGLAGQTLSEFVRQRLFRSSDEETPTEASEGLVDMKVKSIDILTGVSGTDKVGLNLEAESPFPKMGYPASATVEAENGYGLAWAEKHFPGVHIEVMDVKTGKRTIKSATGVVVMGGAGLVAPEPKPFFSSENQEESPRVPARVRQTGEGYSEAEKKRLGEAMSADIAKKKRELAEERFSLPVEQIPPIQDNGPEQPGYSRGGDGPPAPYCSRCQTYHWNRCTR